MLYLVYLFREEAWLTQFAIPLQPFSNHFEREVGGHKQYICE